MSLVQQIVKKFESDKVMTFNDVDPYKNPDYWTSTGSPYIDLKLNTLGFPTGIVELRGPSRCGKTTLSLSVLKYAILNSENTICNILTTERRDNKSYAQRMGLPVEEVIIHQIKNAEMVFNRMKQTIKNTEEVFAANKIEYKPRFIFVLDSLGGLISKQEQDKFDTNSEKDEDKAAPMAATARAFKAGCRWLTGEIYDKNILFLVINHTYDDVNGNGGKKSYGGNGIEYMPSLRLDIARSFQGADLKSGDEIIGQCSQIKAFKNDFNGTKTPFKIEIALGIGIVLSPDDIAFGIQKGLLKKNGVGGASFLNGKLKWSTRKELYALYKSHNSLLRVLTKKLIMLAHEQVMSERKNEELSYNKNVKIKAQ
jgi:recombination protein RecA